MPFWNKRWDPASLAPQSNFTCPRLSPGYFSMPKRAVLLKPCEEGILNFFSQFLKDWWFYKIKIDYQKTKLKTKDIQIQFPGFLNWWWDTKDKITVKLLYRFLNAYFSFLCSSWCRWVNNVSWDQLLSELISSSKTVTFSCEILTFLGLTCMNRTTVGADMQAKGNLVVKYLSSLQRCYKFICHI